MSDNRMWSGLLIVVAIVAVFVAAMVGQRDRSERRCLAKQERGVSVQCRTARK